MVVVGIPLHVDARRAGEQKHISLALVSIGVPEALPGAESGTGIDVAAQVLRHHGGDDRIAFAHAVPLHDGAAAVAVGPHAVVLVVGDVERGRVVLRRDHAGAAAVPLADVPWAAHFGAASHIDGTSERASGMERVILGQGAGDGLLARGRRVQLAPGDRDLLRRGVAGLHRHFGGQRDLVSQVDGIRQSVVGHRPVRGVVDLRAAVVVPVVGGPAVRLAFLRGIVHLDLAVLADGQRQPDVCGIRLAGIPTVAQIDEVPLLLVHGQHACRLRSECGAPLVAYRQQAVGAFGHGVVPRVLVGVIGLHASDP